MPALLNGIEYEGKTYPFMLHPTLNTERFNGNEQRQAMVNLRNHMRRQYLPNTPYHFPICYIFDVEILFSIIDTDSFSSSSSLSDTNSTISQSSENSSENNCHTKNILSLILLLQVN
jgi:hypothetical protein